MSSELTRFHLDHVDSHVNQTELVERLFSSDLEIDFSDVEGRLGDQEIFQWLAFPNFGEIDRERFIQAHIPVLETDFGSWVGITSFGSHYDIYVYPELISALFEVDCSYEEIQRIRNS